MAFVVVGGGGGFDGERVDGSQIDIWFHWHAVIWLANYRPVYIEPQFFEKLSHFR